MGFETVHKTLLITWNYPPKVGGMEQLLYQLVEEIRSSVHVDVIAPYSDEVDQEREHEWVIRSQRKGLLGFFTHAVVKGIKALKESDHDLILGGSALVSPIVFLLGRIFNKPIVVYAHGLDLIYENTLYQFVIKFILPHVDLLLTNSMQTKHIAMKTGVEEKKVAIIPPGIHTDDYRGHMSQEDLKRKYDLEGKKILLYVGRLARRKGVPEFIYYVLPMIVKKHQDLVFCVIGGNPEQSLMHKENVKQQIENTVQEQGLEEYVRLFGWVERDVLLDMYQACDVFILPAIHVPGDMEGFGIVLAEANAAGKPAVSSKIGGVPDAVVDGESAILNEPEDWEAYTKAVLRLLEDESLRKKMGVFGYEHVKSELDWQVIGDKFINTIRSVY
jgi:phosphatidylinositol alpha-1,6-mannosyltransferase